MTDQNRQSWIAGAGALFGVLVIAALFWFSGEDVPEASAPATATPLDAETDAGVLETIRPAFDLVRISRGGTGVIAGQMSPGATVELYANGSLIASEVADQNGEWVMILNEPLNAGSVELNLKARLDENNDPVEAADVVVVSVPEREVERFVERADNGVVAVLTPRDGEGGSRILQRPGGQAFSEVGDSLRVETLDYGNGTTYVAGVALPRVEVRLYLDGAFKGASKADDDGRWAVTLAEDLASGAHTIRLDQTLSGDDVELRVEQPFVTGQPFDPSEAASGILVQPGNTLWHIARRLYGSGVRYTVIFRENSEQIVDPDKIYPGQLFRIPNARETAVSR